MPAIDIKLALVVVAILAIIGLVVWVGTRLAKGARSDEQKKSLTEKLEAHEQFEEDGKDWDAAGGLGGAVARGLPHTSDEAD